MAEKYSGGYILFCTERQVGAVIVMFLTSASQVYFVCVQCDTCCATVVIYYESDGTSMYFFPEYRYYFISGMWVPSGSLLNLGFYISLNTEPLHKRSLDTMCGGN